MEGEVWAERAAACLLLLLMLMATLCAALRLDVAFCGVHCSREQLEDLQSTNGVIHRRGDGPAVRVSEVTLEHGDSITFGGAKSTAVGSAPGPKVSEATRSSRVIHGNTCQCKLL